MNANKTNNGVILANDVDLSNITFSAPKQNKQNAGRTIFINYAGGDLFLQTPCMIAPFGISTWAGDHGGPDKHTLDLSFAGMEANPGIQQFHDMLERLTTLVLDTAMEKSVAWFKKTAPSRDFLNQIFNKMIRYSKDKITGEESTIYPPSFKLNLTMKEGKFAFETFDSNRTEIDLVSMLAASPRPCKGARVKAIIHLSSIWVVGQSQFGVSWKVVGLRIKMPPSLQGYSFVNDSDDEDDNVDDGTAYDSDKLVDSKRVAKSVSGSDGEDTSAPGALAENDQLFM